MPGQSLSYHGKGALPQDLPALAKKDNDKNKDNYKLFFLGKGNKNPENRKEERKIHISWPRSFCVDLDSDATSESRWG
jgi:hypothetical protein